jgi:hypothetical protein
MKDGKTKTIRITCRGADLVPLSDLASFQGNLKTLPKAEHEKLRRAIEKHGFSFPVAAWKRGKSNHIIDGHQRVVTVAKMLKDGYVLAGGKLPVDWIEAKNSKEAKKKVLLAASQYGRYTKESVAMFLEDSALDWDELKLEIDLPALNMKELVSFEANSKKEKVVADDLQFKILIVCTSEKQQRVLLVEFEKRKFECQALMF